MIEGFDCQFPEPDIVVFQPNERRSRDSVTGLVVLVVFLSVWAAGPMFFWLNAVGLLHSKIEPPFPHGLAQSPAVWMLDRSVRLGTGRRDPAGALPVPAR
jgi:hypothetical protein